MSELMQLLKRQTAELNEQTGYIERLKADIANYKARLEPTFTEVRQFLYGPLFPSRRVQAVPNRLWLVTSLALVAAGSWIWIA
jgi:hypothetical protein